LLPILGENEPNKCDNKQILVIVTAIWRKLSTVERNIMLIVIHYWQLLSEIIGGTSLIVTHYWRNPTFDQPFKNDMMAL
jgi:hypothetical protein